MAYDEQLAARIRERLDARPDVTERKMFGGLGFMVGGNMAVAVMTTGGMIVRLEPEEARAAIAAGEGGPFGREGAKPMTGFVVVDPEDDADLDRWVEAGANFAATLPPK